jgi:DNA polymerase-3 subunit delta'
MPFTDILGQTTAIDTLQRALQSGKVHHAYRFEGPDGVGKEKAAFALAQCLECTQPTGALACGTCSACRRVVTLSDEPPQVPKHPDVVLLERGLYPASTLGTDGAETSTINLPQIRKLVQSRIGYLPHEGRALVFIIRRADELNVNAANALLKTLEEPADKTHFILLTSRPHRLLDTIRSRTLAVRFAPLADDVLGAILDRHGASRSVIPLAAGSASLGLALADEQQLAAKQDFVSALFAGLEAPDLATALSKIDVKGNDRLELRSQLSWFAQHLAAASRDQIGEQPTLAERDARRYSMVLSTMKDLEHNANPALALEALVSRMRRI